MQTADRQERRLIRDVTEATRRPTHFQTDRKTHIKQLSIESCHSFAINFISIFGHVLPYLEVGGLYFVDFPAFKSPNCRKFD